MTSALASRIALASMPYNAVKIKEKSMYDPRKPESIFDGNNLVQFAQGLNNAYALKHGLGGDLSREDVGVCMVALDNSSTDTLLVRAERLESMEVSENE